MNPTVYRKTQKVVEKEKEIDQDKKIGSYDE